MAPLKGFSSVELENEKRRNLETSTARYNRDDAWMLTTNQVYHGNLEQWKSCGTGLAHGVVTPTVCKFRKNRTVDGKIFEGSYGAPRAWFDKETGIWFGCECQAEQKLAECEQLPNETQLVWQPWCSEHMKNYQNPRKSGVGCRVSVRVAERQANSSDWQE